MLPLALTVVLLFLNGAGYKNKEYKDKRRGAESG